MTQFPCPRDSNEIRRPRGRLRFHTSKRAAMRMVTNRETLADPAYQSKWPTETSMWCIQFQGKKYFPSDTVRESNKVTLYIHY